MIVIPDAVIIAVEVINKFAWNAILLHNFYKIHNV